MDHAMIWKQLFYLYTAPAIFLLIALLIHRYVRTQQSIKKLCAPQHQKQLLHNFSLPRRIAQLVCIGTALILLWLALLRPQGPSLGKISTIERGRDVIIALDISRSMLAQDYQPNRLTFAKQKIRSLLTRLSSERVGLIIFSGSAIVQCPLTKDFDAFLMFLDALDAETVSGGTTAIDSALQTAIHLWKENLDRKNKLLVICTDGEDFSQNLSAIQAEAKNLHIHVCTLGIGTPQGAPIPLYDEQKQLIGHQKDSNGTIVMTRINEKILSTIASTLSGKYIRAANNDTDITALHEWLTAFEKEDLGTATEEQHEEYFMFFTAAAFLLLLIEWIL